MNRKENIADNCALGVLKPSSYYYYYYYDHCNLQLYSIVIIINWLIDLQNEMVALGRLTTKSHSTGKLAASILCHPTFRSNSSNIYYLFQAEFNPDPNSDENYNHQQYASYAILCLQPFASHSFLFFRLLVSCHEASHIQLGINRPTS